MSFDPLHLFADDDPRKRCRQLIEPAVELLMNKAFLAGWSREEVLIAISDAADDLLCEITEGPKPGPQRTEPRSKTTARPSPRRRHPQANALSAQR